MVIHRKSLSRLRNVNTARVRSSNRLRQKERPVYSISPEPESEEESGDEKRGKENNNQKRKSPKGKASPDPEKEEELTIGGIDAEAETDEDEEMGFGGSKDETSALGKRHRRAQESIMIPAKNGMLMSSALADGRNTEGGGSKTSRRP